MTTTTNTPSNYGATYMKDAPVTLPISDEEVEFLKTLATKLNEDGEVLVQTDEDTAVTAEPTPATVN